MLYMIPQSVRTCRISVLCLVWTAGMLYPGHSSLLGNVVVRCVSFFFKQEEVRYAKRSEELILMNSEDKSAVGQAGALTVWMENKLSPAFPSHGNI